VVRILRNTCRKVSKEEKAKMLSWRMAKLRLSGYGERERWNILRAGVVGYYRMVETEAGG
jgi:hypothetical protein